MNTRAAGFFGIALLLSGCGDADWDHLLSYDTGGKHDTETSQVANADAPPPTAEQPIVGPQPSYTVTQTVTTMTPVTPVASVDPTINYCKQVAQSARATAVRDGRDETIQQGTETAVYRQCMQVYGPSGH